MKILQVIDTLYVGGAERVFVNMCNLLKEHEQDVTALILLPNNGELASQLKVPVVQLNRKNKWSLATMHRCSQEIKKYEIIHCHFRHVYAYISLVNLIFVCQSKVILHDHYGSIDIDKKSPILFKSLLRPKYYIGVSRTLVNWSIEDLKISGNRVFLLSNIIRKNTFPQKPDIDFDLILVSNIKPVKNNLFAVELAKYLNRSLLLIGKAQDQEYFIKVKNEFDNNISVDQSVDNAQAIAKGAKIGLHTSKSETGPLVLIEYLAQGLPFLAYETGEVAKILKPHFPEYFIDNFDIDQWKDRIDLISELDVDIEKMNTVFEIFFGEKQYYLKLIKIYKCISDY